MRRRELIAVLSRPTEMNTPQPIIPDFHKRRESLGIRPLDRKSAGVLERFEQEGQEG